MTAQAEIYFYCDPTYDRDLSDVLGPLEKAGHKVVMGKDPEELKLLVQIERPTLIIFTFISEGSALSAAFKIVSRTALNHNVPILVVGPYFSSEGLVLHVPEGSQFKKRAVPFDMMLTAVEQLRDNPLPKRFTDTEISTEGIFDTNYDEPALEQAHEPQPVSKIIETQKERRGEISGPIALPVEAENKDKSRSENRPLKMSTVPMFVGGAICLIAALAFSTIPTTTAPKEVRLSNLKRAGGMTIATDNQGKFVTELNLKKGAKAKDDATHAMETSPLNDGGPDKNGRPLAR